MPDTPDGAARAGWWQCLAVDGGRAPVWLAVVWSDRHPDGHRTELVEAAAEREVGEDAVAAASYGTAGEVTGLRLGPRGAPAGPGIWFAEYRETNATPPAVSLMAFAGHGVAPGSLVDPAGLAGLPVENDDQLAAVRWYPGTGEVDQIYVRPDRRRQRLGSAMIGAAAALSYARGWPRLWSDGQRTELGEQFRNASPWQHRTADLTHLAPPMTPGEG
jgi:GNAT superfamily N-acetyltransferase